MSKSKAPAAREPMVVERTYRASLDEVWDLWTTKEGFESWWGPEGFRVAVRTLDARVGGELDYEMIADTPEMVAAMKAMGQPPSHGTRGTFVDVRPKTRLAITHVIDFLPGVKPYDSTMTVELTAVGPNVRMVVTLDPMHTAEMSGMQHAGFTSQLRKLDGRFGPPL